MALFLALIMAFSAGNAHSDDAKKTFKSSEFLTWNRRAQESYFDANVGMAALIARQNKRQQGECIEAWYYKNVAKASDEILRIMKNFDQYHPRGVILAVVEKHCGELTF